MSLPVDETPRVNTPIISRVYLIFVLFFVELIGLTCFFLPNLRFTRFAYCDSGADFTIQALIDRGLRPTIDFGYIYGLLPLAINRLWQGVYVFGKNLEGYAAFPLLCNVGLVIGLARLTSTLRTGWVGIALIMLAMPDLLQASTIVLVHALEPAVLINALAFQAKGRRDIALALATACVFIKPAMGFVYGFVLLVLIFSDPKAAGEPSNPWTPRLRSLLPASAVAILLALLLAAMYGFVPLVHTLIPGAGLEVYKANHYGFFRGAGRAFWWIPGGGLRDYLRFEVGGWIAGTLVLLVEGVCAAIAIGRRRTSPAVEIIFTCALLHGLFVAFFFGNRTSWVYYYSIMISGLMAVSICGRWSRLVIIGLMVIMLIGSKVKLETAASLWKTDVRLDALNSLWASSEEYQDYMRVRELAENHKPVVLLATVEGLTLMDQSLFQPPTVAYFVPGHPLPVEVRRKAEQIENAEMVVIARPKGSKDRGGYGRWPEIGKALAEFETIHDGPVFEVVRRKPVLPK